MKTPLPKKLVSFERRQKLKAIRQKIARTIATFEAMPDGEFHPAKFVAARAKLIELHRQLDALKAEKTIAPTFGKAIKFDVVITH